MKVSLQRVSLPDDRRILMISDIHGHADDLKAILKKARFSRDDILIIVGDLVERGPQSLETVRLVMALREEYAVYPLMGNMDLWRLEFLQSGDPAMWREMRDYSLSAVGLFGGRLLHEMCGELGEPLAMDTDMEKMFPRVQRHFAPEIDFLSRLPTILETQRMIFVHGGIPHERLDELEGTDAFPILKYDDFYSAGLSFQKYVVTGHWPTMLYSKGCLNYNPIVDRERRIICLDGACGVKKEGQLNIMMLPDWRSDDFSFVTQDHLPLITALDSQEGSPVEDAVFIPFNDYSITLLERGKEMSRVLYHGRAVDVPTSYLTDHGGAISCADTTNYVLPVRKGDQLYLILRLDYGCQVKKNGVAGWYFGRYEMNEVKEK